MITYTTIKVLFTLFSILTILYLITSYAAKASKAINTTRYIVAVALMFVLFIALYNTIAAKTGLFRPLSLDFVFDRIGEAFDRFFAWLFGLFRADWLYESVKEFFSKVNELLSW